MAHSSTHLLDPHSTLSQLIINTRMSPCWLCCYNKALKYRVWNPNVPETCVRVVSWGTCGWVLLLLTEVIPVKVHSGSCGGEWEEVRTSSPRMADPRAYSKNHFLGWRQVRYAPVVKWDPCRGCFFSFFAEHPYLYRSYVALCWVGVVTCQRCKEQRGVIIAAKRAL